MILSRLETADFMMTRLSPQFSIGKRRLLPLRNSVLMDAPFQGAFGLRLLRRSSPPEEVERTRALPDSQY
ncbi:hypothetical protein PGT21_026512 [Puccinia graminis f. sp. tritici]|uniref:Uncharacterized protein n=1 Tax=Puccinia graminis f. sp. tritici TaxID=56615 RepID=A0A5B0MY16_PUCGR|nr:hypothetical protein PGT21_026512 [Puccinia graminis f. sp. tritici]